MPPSPRLSTRKTISRPTASSIRAPAVRRPARVSPSLRVHKSQAPADVRTTSAGTTRSSSSMAQSQPRKR